MRRAEPSDFYPRVPCGTRHTRVAKKSQARLFLPTRPLRDATIGNIILPHVLSISTHASLAGRDSKFFVAGDVTIISTHASLAGRDSKSNEKILIRFAQMIQSGSDMLRFSAGFYPFVSFFPARFALCTVRTAREFSVRCSFAVRQSARLPEHIRSWCQNARCAFHTGCQDSKTAGCPFFRP